MVTLGVDAHKRSHTIVAVDANGRQLASKTISTTTKDHLGLLSWAEQLEDGDGLLWAIEDCRHLSRRLERDLLAAGQSIVRVPPKLMAHVRDSARTYGKSDPIDALAVARAAQRESDLPVAASMVQTARCGCLAITANPLSQNGLERSAGCVGTCMSSILAGSRGPAHWTASAHSMRSLPASWTCPGPSPGSLAAWSTSAAS